MKKLFYTWIVIIAISCNTSPVKKTPKMPGAYFMTSQILNDGKTDTKYDDLKQLKIYTDSFVMYAQVNTSDSVSSFGVGTYTADTGTVTENIIYNGRDTTINSNPQSFILDIKTTPDGYEQVIPEIVTDSIKYKLTEIYQKVSVTTKSPLDGVWKEIKSFTLNGKDTTWNMRTQYKAFYSGYFMFGHTYKVSNTQSRTGIGFGTFVMNGNDEMKETDLNSTYAIIAGQTFIVKTEMEGKDHYKQTITNPDGSMSIEYYERLKK